jgi:hypothetical protein
MSYRLPDGIICLIPVFSETNSVSSIISSSEGFRIKDLALGVLKLSLEECTEFIILGFIIMVVQGLLSFHHLEKPENLPLQRLQQQQ